MNPNVYCNTADSSQDMGIPKGPIVGRMDKERKRDFICWTFWRFSQ